MKLFFKAAPFLLAALFQAWSTPARAQDEPEEEEPAKAAWTLMLYSDADNDLEAPMLDDLREMAHAGSSEQINVVVLMDRSDGDNPEEGYTDEGAGGLDDWTTAKWLKVEDGKLTQIADWGEVNMGDTGNLNKFINATVARFPAERYGLIFGDHGGGWTGVCSDESNEHDGLTPNELAGVFSKLPPAVGKLDLVGFDACLMANFEVAQTIAPYAKYMVASEELEPGTGWHYTPVLQKLRMASKTGPKLLGKWIVDAFRDSFLKSPDEDMRDKAAGVTLSVVDLTQVPKLTVAVDNLAKAGKPLTGQERTWTLLAQARSESEEYGASDPRANDGVGVRDLAHFAKNAKAEPPSPAVANAAEGVIQSLRGAVTYTYRGKARQNAHGLSIFFPDDKEKLQEPGAITYAQVGFSKVGNWMGFLSGYMDRRATDTTPPKVGAVTTNLQANLTGNTAARYIGFTPVAAQPEVDDDDVLTVQAKVNPDEVDESYFALFSKEETEWVALSQWAVEPDENGVLSEAWGGQWFTISDGENDLVCPISDMTEVEDEDEEEEAADEEEGEGDAEEADEEVADDYWAQVPVQVKLGGKGQWRDVMMFFYLDFNQEEVAGQFVYAFSETASGIREMEFSPGTQIRPVYYSIDDEGEEHHEPADDPEHVLTVENAEDDLSVGMEEVTKGTYSVGFIVSDYSGNKTEQAVQFEYEGEEEGQQEG